MQNIPTGTGLGFRRELIPELKVSLPSNIDFFEIAPENWMGMGGQFEADLRYFSQRIPFVCHGLSLSLGGTSPLDVTLLKNIKAFMRLHNISLFTEHLSWCSDDGHLYDLLPIPFTEEAIKWAASRIRKTQDILGRQIGVENASYYVIPPEGEMSEAEFINAVINEADCLLHLDVNNIYVNSINFGFDAEQFLCALPLDKTCYIHVAGHYVEPDGIIVDTHGSNVIDPVWSLLYKAYAKVGRKAEELPTCLERDFNLPALKELTSELDTINSIRSRAIQSSSANTIEIEGDAA